MLESAADIIERRITEYEKKLCDFFIDRVTIATYQASLAKLYLDRIRGSRAENLETSIELNVKAVSVYTKKSHPVEWGNITNNLAMMYKNRIN